MWTLTIFGYTHAVFMIKSGPAPATGSMAHVRSDDMEIVVVDKLSETLPGYVLPCIDCGHMTGSWCDGCEKTMEEQKKRLTPLCSICEKHVLVCHRCRGVAMATPFAWWMKDNKVVVFKR